VSDHIPIVCVRLQSQPTVSVVASDILKRYGDPSFEKGKPYNLSCRVDRYICACDTHVLLIDESQRIVDRGGVVASEDLLNWLVDRKEATNVQVIFVGLGRLRHLIDKDDSTERRLNRSLRLEPYPWPAGEGLEDESDQLSYVGAVQSILTQTRMTLELDFEKDLDCYRTWYAGRGALGYWMKILERMATLREMEGSESRSFSIQDLQAAYDSAFGDGQVNPFTKNFSLSNRPLELSDDTVPLPPTEVRRRQKTKAQRQHELAWKFSKAS
jgi:hypothetical protein